jgi:nucleosome binding factor SPN SPT16 subunit
MGKKERNRERDMCSARFSFMHSQCFFLPSSASSFPNDAAPHRLVVDQENETILIPINGYVVPVHISLIKQVTKLDDTIRFQFIVPGKGKMSQPANLIIDEQPNVVWIKEVVYHLKNSNLLSSIERSIKEMRKRVTAQEKRKADLAGLAEQDALLLSREKPLMLTALYARPALAGKRVLGTLEAHRNGFRYTTNKGEENEGVRFLFV